MNYRIAKNYDDYLTCCKEVRYKKVGENCYGDKCIAMDDETWRDFFGAKIKQDEDGKWLESIRSFNGDVDLKPKENEYPVILVFHFEKSFDRFGDSAARIWDWIPLKKLGITI